MMSVNYVAGPPPRVAPSESPSGGTAIASAGFVPQTPSKWVHDSARSSCAACHAQFSFFTRRHHCRNCREVFCDACTGYRLLTPDKADRTRMIGVRACKSCFDKYKGRKSRAAAKDAKPRAAAAATVTSPAQPQAAVSAAQLSTDNVKISAPAFDAAADVSNKLQERSGYYVQRLNSEGVEVQSGDVEQHEQDGEDAMDDYDLDEVFEEEEEEEQYDDVPTAAASPLATVSLATSAPPDQQQSVYKAEGPVEAATPLHASKSVEMESVAGKAGQRAVEGKRLQAGEKDEFEREGRDSEGQQELLNIPSDVLASVSHRAGSSTAVQPQPAALMQSEEAAQSYSERNVERRYIAPPSPITGVADLMQLTSPSAVPQPLLNTLNDPKSRPEDVARLANPAPQVSSPVFAAPGPNTVGKAPPVSRTTATELSSTAKTSTDASAPIASKTVPSAAPSAAGLVISPFVPSMSSPQSSTQTLQSSTSSAGAPGRSSAAPLNPAVDVPPWPASAAADRPAPAAVRPVAASTVDLPATAHVPAAELVDGGDVHHIAQYSGRVHPRDSSSEPAPKRFVLKRRKVDRAPRRWAPLLLRPAPLIGLALLAVAFMAFFPLPLTIFVTLLAVMVPVLYSYLTGKRRPPGFNLRRDLPGLAAEHDALLKQKELYEWEQRDAQMDGLAALPSPAFSQHYASQQSVEPAVDTAAVGVQQQGIERETAPVSIPKQLAPKPQIVI